MTPEVEYLRGVLRQASEALTAACTLLDRQLGAGWRREWAIADIATLVNREANGWPTFEDAEEEAERRNAAEGLSRDNPEAWGVWVTAEGAPVVTKPD